MPILLIHPGPVPNEDQIRHVATSLASRGAAWAQAYMTKTGGADNYPVALVRRIERQALTEQPAAPAETAVPA